MPCAVSMAILGPLSHVDSQFCHYYLTLNLSTSLSSETLPEITRRYKFDCAPSFLRILWCQSIFSFINTNTSVLFPGIPSVKAHSNHSFHLFISGIWSDPTKMSSFPAPQTASHFPHSVFLTSSSVHEAAFLFSPAEWINYPSDHITDLLHPHPTLPSLPAELVTPSSGHPQPFEHASLSLATIPGDIWQALPCRDLRVLLYVVILRWIPPGDGRLPATEEGFWEQCWW